MLQLPDPKDLIMISPRAESIAFTKIVNLFYLFPDQDMWLTTKLTNWKSSLYMLLKIFLETGSKLKSIPIPQCESRKRGKSWIRRRYQP